MSRWLVAVASVAIIGCSNADSKEDSYGSGFVEVSEAIQIGLKLCDEQKKKLYV